MRGVRRLRGLGRLLCAQLARLLVRLRGEAWVPPGLMLRVLRISFAGWSTGLRAPAGSFAYRGSDGTAYGVDLVRPDTAAPRLVVIWLHGGGWFFGSRRDVLPYLTQICGDGVAALAVDYPLAPEARHPEPLRALARGLPAVIAEAGLSDCRIVLAGDSAGAGLAAALARLVCEEQYAAGVGIDAPFPRERLAGLLLCCGVYSPIGTRRADRWSAAALGSSAWALARTRRWQDSAVARDLDAAGRTSQPLPPTLLVSAAGDPLHAGQTAPFASTLRRLGSPVEEWVATDSGAGHEFQMDTRSEAGARALNKARSFLAGLCAHGAERRPESDGL